jgi:hypothetical protein
MKSNQTLFLGVIAALGILAGVLWVYRTGTPARPDAATKPAASAKSDDSAVALPAPVTSALTPTAHLALPPNVTETGELPPMRENRAFFGMVDSLPQLNKLLEQTYKATGGEALQKSLLAAKWRLIVTLPARALFVTMQTDAAGGLYAKDEELGTEWFLVHDTCRVHQGSLVLACLKEQDEFVHGLFLGQLAAVPLRLKGYPLTMDGVIDTKDVIYLQLPGQDKQSPIRVQISREDGSVVRAQWSGVTASPERNRLEGEPTTPNAWSMDETPVAPEPRGKGAAKRSQPMVTWQAAVRVLELKPNADKAPIKLPELSGVAPMTVTARPAMSVMVVPLGGHPPVEDIRVRLNGALRYEGLLDLIVYEALAPASQAPKLNQGVELWVASPPQGIATPVPKQNRREIPAAAKIARKVVRGSWPDVPAQMAKFVDEVKAAGHQMGPGPTVVRCVYMDAMDDILVELQVPLQ